MSKSCYLQENIQDFLVPNLVWSQLTLFHIYNGNFLGPKNLYSPLKSINGLLGK